jgi:hypothetical protein
MCSPIPPHLEQLLSTAYYQNINQDLCVKDNNISSCFVWLQNVNLKYNNMKTKA